MSDEDRRLVQSLSRLDKLLSPDTWKPIFIKCAQESTRSRNEGNSLYAASNHEHVNILRWYARAAAYAPQGSRELGLAHGNRSAALVHMGRYVEAVRDLDEAMKTDVEDKLRVKYMVRKIECQVELGMTEAEDTCADTRRLLQEMKESDEFKKDMVIKLVNAIVKLKKGEFKVSEVKQKLELPNAAKLSNNRSSEHPDASIALSILYNPRYPSRGRHLAATQNIPPGEVLYAGEPYLNCPAESHLYTNCSHCLRFAWSALPCPSCVYAVYCCKECREDAWREYHDMECKVIGRIWKVKGERNVGRLMAVRLLVKSVREAGGLEELRKSVGEVDACKDSRTKGFSTAQKIFSHNHRAAYSLQTHMRKKPAEDLRLISEDSVVLLHLLARFAPMFRRHFEYDKRALIANDAALFIGRMLSHYQHVVLINSSVINDVYTPTSVDWTWTAMKEDDATGLYLNPFLSLLNHSCHPNVAKCEMEDRRTILFSILPIAKGEQICCSYGPTYADLPKRKRMELLQRFHFTCNCVACENDWPEFSRLIANGITYLTLSSAEINATIKAQEKTDRIVEALEDGNFNFDYDDINDLVYAIVVTIVYCKLPNWRLASLTATLTAVFQELYGYIVDVSETCKDGSKKEK